MVWTSQICLGWVRVNGVLKCSQIMLCMHVCCVCAHCRFVIECKQCGVIYRSRQHWYGNKDPELEAVKTENKHIWPEV